PADGGLASLLRGAARPQLLDNEKTPPNANDLLPESGGSGRSRRIVHIQAGPDNRRVPDPPRELVSQPRGCTDPAERPFLVQGQHGNRIMIAGPARPLVPGSRLLLLDDRVLTP